jgi:hypothetical protein
VFHARQHQRDHFAHFGNEPPGDSNAVSTGGARSAGLTAKLSNRSQRLALDNPTPSAPLLLTFHLLLL